MSTRTLALSPIAGVMPCGRLSKAMRTLRRCTTFTQLPEEFCVGSTEKGSARAGAQAGHVAVERLVRIRVDVDHHGLTRLQMFKLIFLERSIDPWLPGDQPEEGLRRLRISADLDLIDARDDPSRGARMVVSARLVCAWVSAACAASTAGC